MDEKSVTPDEVMSLFKAARLLAPYVVSILVGLAGGGAVATTLKQPSPNDALEQRVTVLEAVVRGLSSSVESTNRDLRAFMRYTCVQNAKSDVARAILECDTRFGLTAR